MKPSDIKFILIHNSASDWGDAAEIHAWHTRPPPKGNGWKYNGYHKIILNQYPTYRGFVKRLPNTKKDGLVEDGRPMTWAGAHEQKYNKNSIGICLIGRGPKFTDKQMSSLRKLVLDLMKQYGIPAKNVLGHAEVDKNKRDPGFDMNEFRASLR